MCACVSVCVFGVSLSLGGVSVAAITPDSPSTQKHNV